MPIYRGVITPHDGPLARVRIGLSRGEVAKLMRAGLPVPQAVEVPALVDSGAECTCIDPSVLASLPLPRTSYGLVNAPGVAGVGFNFGYEASLTLLHPSKDPKQNLVIPTITLVRLGLIAVGYKAVLGRDSLARCLYTHDGPQGVFTLAY